MIYDKIMQETMDIDWFMVDRDGYIAHLASGGGALPESVTASIENNKTLLDFFRNHEVVSDVNIEKNNLPRIQSFVDMGAKGLFSYNIITPYELSCTTYERLINPFRSILLKDLPEDIAAILSRTKSDQILFSESKKIDWAKLFE